MKIPAAGLTTRRSTANRCSPWTAAPCVGHRHADPLEQLVEVLGRGDRDRAAALDRALGHAGEHPTGAELGEVGDAQVGELEQAVLPPDGARQLRREQRRPLLALVVGEGVDVGDDRDLGVADVGDGDRFAQAVAGRRHVRRVERARHRQRHHPLGAELLGVQADAASTPIARPGDHDLSGRVEVGDPDLLVGAPARDLDLIVVEAEHRGHRAGMLEAGFVHRRRRARRRAGCRPRSRSRRSPTAPCTRRGCDRRRSWRRCRCVRRRRAPSGSTRTWSAGRCGCPSARRRRRRATACRRPAR